MTEQEMVLLTEICTERECGRLRYSELTDDANTHWHVKRGVALVPVESLPELARLRAVVTASEALVEEYGQRQMASGSWSTSLPPFLNDLRAALGAAVTPTQPDRDPADYGPAGDNCQDASETTCRTCGALAIDHTRGRYSIYGVCPVTPTPEATTDDEYCGCGCGHCAKKVGWPVDENGIPLAEPAAVTGHPTDEPPTIRDDLETAREMMQHPELFPYQPPAGPQPPCGNSQPHGAHWMEPLHFRRCGGWAGRLVPQRETCVHFGGCICADLGRDKTGCIWWLRVPVADPEEKP